MQPLELRALRAKTTVDQGAKDELDRILAITTQLPDTAQFQPGGAAALTINGVSVRILPDTRQGKENETGYRLVPDHVQVPGIAFRKRRVTAINGPMPVTPVVEIYTTYAAQGPKSAADPATATSGYGRGTTDADKAAKTTSLRFHESRHGQDYLTHIATHPFPQFTGRVGMTVAAWNTASSTYLEGFKAWSTAMGHASLCATDCVGSPNIDAFEHNTGRRMKCRTCRP